MLYLHLIPEKRDVHSDYPIGKSYFVVELAILEFKLSISAVSVFQKMQTEKTNEKKNRFF